MTIATGVALAYVATVVAGGGSAQSGHEIRQLQVQAVITGDLLADAGADVSVSVSNPTGSTLRWSPTEDDLHPTVTVDGSSGSCDAAKWDFYWVSEPHRPIIVGPNDSKNIGTGNVGVSTRYNATGCAGATVHLNWAPASR